jgi:hypothetical protein
MNLWITIPFLGAAVVLGSPQSPKPLTSGPIGYYDGACAHCHGTNGSAYSDDFFKKYDLSTLKKSINDMAEGPGQSPLDGQELAAQVAYHQAIIAHLPFIAWTGQAGQNLSGEVTRKATMSASINREELTVIVKGTKWTLELPVGKDASSVVLTATLSGKSVTLNLGKVDYSTPHVWPPKIVIHTSGL